MMLIRKDFAKTKSAPHHLADSFPLPERAKRPMRTVASPLRVGRVVAMLVIIMASVWPQAPAEAAQAFFPAFHLPYFALTGSLQTPLRLEAPLAPFEFGQVQSIARRQLESYRLLESQTALIISNPALTLPQKRLAILRMGYNSRVDQVAYQADQSLRQALSPASYARLMDWITRRWPLERRLHGRGKASVRTADASPFSSALYADASPFTLLPPNASPYWIASPLQSARSYKIYATHYKAKSGAYTVALPDKCLKFANGGLHTCDDLGYIAGGNYSIILTFQGSTGAVVGEAGPWNIDDNFWASLNDPTPRRMFADLALGMPEAQAAYFNGYNGGADQYGRKVTGPYAIDLSEGVGNDIGLKWGVSDWVTVSFMWTADWGAGGGGVQPTWPPGVTPPASSGGIVPVQTVTYAPDGSQVHRVQPGQSLWAIAIAYGTTILNLRQLNSLGESSVIVPGQDLIVRPPGPTSTLDATQSTALAATYGRGYPAPTDTTPAPAKQTQKAEKRLSTAQAENATAQALAAALSTPSGAPASPSPASAPALAPALLHPLPLAALLLVVLGLALLLIAFLTRRRTP
jgi:LysM repeat protein